MENIKVAIGIPSSGLLDWRFASSLMSLQLSCDTRVIWMIRAMIATARNKIVEQTLTDPSYTHLLFLDDDMTFEPDFLTRLLSNDSDIVGGLAFKRTKDYQPCVYRKNEKGEYCPILPEVFQEVDVIGTAGMLIKTELFKKIKFPWFENFYDKEGKNWSVDFDFCIKAKKQGFKIFVDPEAEMGHIGMSDVVTKETFLREYNLINKKQ
jgi:hypothetical protein